MALFFFGIVIWIIIYILFILFAQIMTWLGIFTGPEREHRRQNEKPIARGGGVIIGMFLVVWLFHAPLGYIFSSQINIPLADGIRASFNCSTGWIGSALIWISLGGAGAGLVELCRRKKYARLGGAMIFAGLSTWYVWVHLDPIKASHEAIKSKEAAKEIDAQERNPEKVKQIRTSSPSEKASAPTVVTSNTPTTTAPAESPPAPPKAENHQIPPASPTSPSKPDLREAARPPQSVGTQNGQPELMEVESTDGRRILGKILVVTTTSIFVRRDDGQEFEIPLSRLTAETKQRIAQHRDSKRQKRFEAPDK